MHESSSASTRAQTWTKSQIRSQRNPLFGSRGPRNSVIMAGTTQKKTRCRWATSCPGSVEIIVIIGVEHLTQSARTAKRKPAAIPACRRVPRCARTSQHEWPPATTPAPDPVAPTAKPYRCHTGSNRTPMHQQTRTAAASADVRNLDITSDFSGAAHPSRRRLWAQYCVQSINAQLAQQNQVFRGPVVVQIGFISCPSLCPARRFKATIALRAAEIRDAWTPASPFVNRITFVASHLPTFCSLPLAKRARICLASRLKADLPGW